MHIILEPLSLTAQQAPAVAPGHSSHLHSHEFPPKPLGIRAGQSSHQVVGRAGDHCLLQPPSRRGSPRPATPLSSFPAAAVLFFPTTRWFFTHRPHSSFPAVPFPDPRDTEHGALSQCMWVCLSVLFAAGPHSAWRVPRLWLPNILNILPAGDAEVVPRGCRTDTHVPEGHTEGHT